MRKFLVFQHIRNESPGLISDWASKRGVKLEVVEFWEKFKIPSVGDYSGLIILGGPMGVYEEFPSKEAELGVIKEALGRVPMIGFCLGSQLIAYSLGAQVHPNIIGGEIKKEIGYLKVSLTEDGENDPLFRGFDKDIKVLQWHGDSFDLPLGATLLASSKACVNQAFRFGKITYGVLFHNEFTPQMVNAQIRNDRTWIHKDFLLDEKKKARGYGKPEPDERAVF